MFDLQVALFPPTFHGRVLFSLLFQYTFLHYFAFRFDWTFFSSVFWFYFLVDFSRTKKTANASQTSVGSKDFSSPVKQKFPPSQKLVCSGGGGGGKIPKWCAENSHPLKKKSGSKSENQRPEGQPPGRVTLGVRNCEGTILVDFISNIYRRRRRWKGTLFKSAPKPLCCCCWQLVLNSKASLISRQDRGKNFKVKHRACFIWINKECLRGSGTGSSFIHYLVLSDWLTLMFKTNSEAILRCLT